MRYFTPWPPYPSIYEINTRVWLAELSRRAGHPLTLDSVPDEEFESLAHAGMHALWLMGVWTVGSEPRTIAREHPDLQASYRRALSDVSASDIIGSPYAVTAYEVSPLLGGREALARLRERISRKFGLKLILDFVSNHVARDHAFVSDRPELFVQGTSADLSREPQNYFRSAGGSIIAHGRDPYFPGWTDTAQLNFAQRATRDAMLQVLLDIAAQCDGMRCDMAMLLLPDVIQRVWGARLGSSPVSGCFWEEALPKIQQTFPDTLMIAEAYWDTGWRLLQQGFHFTYDKTLYDRLRSHDFQGLRKHLTGDSGYQSRCLRFIENHDEERAVVAFGAPRSRSAAIASFFAPGARLFHEGQFEGRRVRLPVQLGRRPVEGEDYETAVFYEKILRVMPDPIFQNGSFSLLPVNSTGWGDSSHNALVAYAWRPSDAAASPETPLDYLIVVNLGDARAYGRIPLSSQIFARDASYNFHDHLDDKHYERDGGELVYPGLYVALEAHQAHLFRVTRK